MSRLGLGLLALVVLLARPAVGQVSPGDVIINEIMYAPSPSSNEFVEIYNRSDAPVRLDRLALADANRSYSPITSADTTLPPDAYAVLVRDPVAFTDAFPDVHSFDVDGWQAFNNGGDTVYLRHEATQTVLDSVAYDPSWGGADDQSLERRDPAGPSNVASNFAASEAPAGATPGARNSVYDPDESPPEIEHVQPARNGDSLSVTFSEPLDPATVSADNFQFETMGTPSVISAQISDENPTRVHCSLASSLSTGEYTLVVSGVSDLPGNAINDAHASFSFFVAEDPAPADIIISEILYAPPQASNEFVELYNRSDKTIDLGTLQIADENLDFDRAAPPLTPLEPGSYAVLVRDKEAFASQFPSVEAHAPAGWDALNNGGDTVVLRHGPSAPAIDSVPFQPSWGGSNGSSLERIDPQGPSTLGSNFASSTAAQGATPGSQNSRHQPDTEPPTPTFAEMVGETTAEVVFDEPIDSESATPSSFSFESTTVNVVSTSSARTVRLKLANTPSAPTMSVSGIQDHVGNTLDDHSLPLAYRPTPAGLVINEIMYAPRADDFDNRPNQVEYIELYNITDRAFTLNDLVMTDRPTEEQVADTIRTGRRQAVAPDSYAVVAAAPAGSTRVEQSQLATAFPEAPLVTDSVAYLPVDGTRLGLQNSGDLVRIHRADGTPVAEVSYSPDWHTPSLDDPRGTALARIAASGDPNAARNWTSSTAPAGGTPGDANAVSISPPEDAPEAPGLRVEPNPFSLERDGATRIQYTLTDVPNLVRARIFDARGRKVRTIEEARLAGRSGSIVWDGRDDAGNRVRVGVYVVLFEAVRTEAGEVTRLKKSVVFARPLN